MRARSRPSSPLLHRKNVFPTRAWRWCTDSVFHRRRPHRPRYTPRVVRGTADHGLDGGVRVLDDLDADGAIINAAAGQNLRDDLTGDIDA